VVRSLFGTLITRTGHYRPDPVAGTARPQPGSRPDGMDAAAPISLILAALLI
jgi:hypothetical protein